MPSTTPAAITATARSRSGLICPVCARVRPRQIPAGRRATMPAKMISDVPLPTPRAVICSPIHIRNRVPPVSVATVEMTKNAPGSLTTPEVFCSPSAMPKDCTSASTTVR